MAYKDGSKTVGGKGYRQSKGFKDHIRRRDNHTCQLCGKPGHEVDHIIPYAVSGETRPEGCRVLCVGCNRATRRARYDARLPLADWFDSLSSKLPRPTWERAMGL